MDKNKIYEDYHMKVLRYINAKVNDYYLAEDLCSDIFVKVYEKLDSFNENKASISTWIFTITRNRLIDYYRSRKVMVEIPEELTYEVEEDEFDENVLNKLADALQSLDNRSKKLIVMYYYENKKLKDIAEELNISYPYAKVIHKKALLMMKGYFK